jgi:pSer/pThr/pTyr-binding forkhead associated (FHA) protein
MWRISALDRDGREVGRSELTAGELTIGRDADRQLILPSASVSRRHARLFIDGGQPCIVDEGSANGVIVDGVRITQPTYVHPGSRIDVAEFRLAVEPLGQPVEPSPRGSRVTPVPGSLPAVLPPIRLVAEGGPYDGRVYELSATEVAVGRAVDNDVVLDDPSLSRKHARLIRRGPGQIEVEDLGSSNGTFVNERKIGRGTIEPGDLVRFGELAFRVEGDTQRGTSTVDGIEIPSAQLYGLGAGAVATLVLLLIMMIVLVRKPTPVQAPGKEAIARLSKQAAGHLAEGRRLLGDHKFLEAKGELDQALELDPANVEARRLRNLAARAPEDDQTERAAAAKMVLGDRKGLEQAIRLLDDTTEGTPGHEKLQSKLTASLVRFGDAQYAARSWGDSAWALCRAFELAPPDGRPDANAVRVLRDAERHIRDRSFARCRAAP